MKINAHASTLPRPVWFIGLDRWHDWGMAADTSAEFSSSSSGEEANPTTTSDELKERGSARSQRPSSRAFREFIAAGWAPRPTELPERRESADFALQRRQRTAQHFDGERLVIPAGGLKVRSNDTDYRFRPHSAFAHLSGLGTDEEPDAVLVIEPDGEGELFFRPRAPRDSQEFYADARYGELWVGVRPSLEEVQAETGLVCRHIDELSDAVAKDVGPESGAVQLRVIRDADTSVTALVDQVRLEAGIAQESDERETHDGKLSEFLSELRLVKDSWEIDQMRQAIAATANGFEDVVRELPRAIGHPRGERVIEGAFGARAREEGNGLGYDTIAASGANACTLHWIRNDGKVDADDLVLIDAGVEVDSLYTADITRTLPVSGTFSPAQRQVYQAVLDAADAAFSVVKPGVKFRDVHAAAMEVIAARLEKWGLLPVSAAESLSQDGGFHRRWMVHGTSHHLGIDVHDCAQARREMYLDAELEPGMIFTIEPGLYFRAEDLSVPDELRGIGVRIEDDVLVTESGYENLTAALPRTPDAVEQWMADIAKR